MTQTPTDAVIEQDQNKALCAASRAIVERDYRPRPCTKAALAPNGQPHVSLMSRYHQTAGEAVKELDGWLRAAAVASQGDTVWWRIVPEVEYTIETRKWRAYARLALGWARDEKPELTPTGADMPAVAAERGMGGQLPTWKCHKVVQADKIVGFSTDDSSGMMKWKLLLDGGVEVTVGNTFLVRVPAGNPVGGYFVRYKDGFESWSPSAAFEDGYTRQTL